jgi:uncharacterized membrane protein
LAGIENATKGAFMNRTRLESFSDGVFGFAITLLVLGVQVPALKAVNDAELRNALLQALSQLVPYVTSFATIGIIWLNHHAMFHSVERVEHTTLTLNLLLLLVVTFIPYPTSVLSRYGAMPSSACLYGCTLTALGVAYSILWLHIARRGLSSVIDDAKHTRSRFRRNLAGSLAYPLGALIALRFPRVSVVIYFLVAIYYFIPSDRATETSGPQ